MKKLSPLLFSVRWRLVASYLAITILTVFAVGWLALLLIRQQMAQRERVLAADVACNVAEAARPLYEAGAATASLLELAQQSAALYNMEVSLLDSAERELAVALPPPPQMVWVETGEGVQVLEPLARQPASGVPLPHVLTVTTPPRSQEPGYCTVGALDETGQPLGYVRVTGGTDLVGPALDAGREGLATAGCVVALIAIFLGLIAGRRLAAPLELLVAAAGEMAQGDLAVRAPVRGRDEVGQLAAQFNLMASRLQESFEALQAERDALRRFVADASHELRTPITALRSFNELLQDGAVADPEVRTEFLAESAFQLERLTWITEHLLDLTRLDAGLAALEIEPCSTAILLQEAVAPFRQRAKEAGIILEVVEPPAPLLLSCDRARLVLALSNLLDNALKFTEAGGRITLAVRITGEVIEWQVSDTGRGIEAGHVEHVFERFYRGARDRPGSGLGLAIVKSVAEAHGGHVTVSSQPGQGSKFVLSLPQTQKRLMSNNA